MFFYLIKRLAVGKKPSANLKLHNFITINIHRLINNTIYTNELLTIKNKILFI